MVVEELVTKLGLEVDSNALATLEKFRNAVVGGLSTMNIAAIGVAGAFLGMVHSVAAAGDAIANTAEKLGVSTTALQELKFAADQSDVTFDALATGLKFVSKNAAEAASGSEEAAKSFAGIAIRNANGQLKTADELLLSVTDRFTEIKDPIKQTDLAIKLFGRSGTELIPMLKQGRKGIEEFISDAYDLGVVLDKDVIEASDRFDRQLKRLRDSFIGLRNTFAGPFVGNFADLMKDAADEIKKARDFVRSLSLAFKDLGSRLGGMVGIVRNIAAAFKGWFQDTGAGKVLDLVKGFKILEAVMIGLGVIAAVTAAETIASWLAAAAPFILLGALIGFIVDDIYNFIKGNDSLIGRIQKWAEAVGPPNEHPIVKMLRTALALLMDLSNPKHWQNFKDAAGDAVDFISEKIRLALGGKKFVKNSRGIYMPEDAEVPSTPEQGGVFGQGGLLDTLGFKRKGYEEAVSKGYIREANGPQTAPGIHLQAPPASFAPVTTININGSHLSGEELQSRVEDALNASYSKALPAVSGGEQ